MAQLVQLRQGEEARRGGVIGAETHYSGGEDLKNNGSYVLNKPYLPIPAGELSLQQAWFLMIFDVLVGLLILRLMNADLITTSLYCLGLILGTFYSTPPFRFKESSVATVIVIPLITGIIQNIGVFYAATASLGLPFWSPSIVFITTFVTVFFVPISLIKDLTDVEGDLKHNIWTFTVTYGHKNIVAVSTGILLLNYIGAIAAAIYMPQAFKLNLMLPAHSLPATWLLIQEACADFFQFLWKLLGLEFLLFPFM
ncbi:Homogentisate phytyltransferase 2 [Morus notabilis]|uniref:Homogentisate phytyltransferase 2 n=1 Tax=Morus notabilis TaxID=981085 RepID=W9R4U3_9ROSA|nr:Homogentisate phytyltransferase 2 [Morus notabilis]